MEGGVSAGNAFQSGSLRSTSGRESCALQDVPKETSRDLSIEQPIAIFRERRRVPDGIVHRQAHRNSGL
jgi:hypothetical protein